MNKEPIGIGVIGMGWMGEVHARSYAQLRSRFGDDAPEVRLVVCADDVTARAESSRAKLGFDACVTDWRKVVEDPAVAAVIVTSPNATHREICEAAAANGKHVFCEKPVGRNGEDTATIERTTREAGLVSGVGYNYRHVPVVGQIRSLIASGRLGEITHYRGNFLVGYGSDPEGALSWRFQRETAGSGCLGDLMSHVIDMAHYQAGPIRSLTSWSHTYIPTRPIPQPGQGTHFSSGGDGPRGPVTNEDYVSALVEFENGARGTFETCRVIKGPGCEMAFEIHGTAGAARWNFERMNEYELFLDSADDPGFSRIFANPTHPHYGAWYPGPANSMGYEDLKVIEALTFAKAVATGEQGTPGFAEALRVAEVEAAMERSWKSGGREEIVPIEV
jgi:predicted dehydrogenase